MANSRSSAIPAGFHPLSREMADVLTSLQEHFSVKPHWRYVNETARRLTLRYYTSLRQVLRRSSRRQRWLAQCRHCGIFFSLIPATVAGRICGVRSDAVNIGAARKAIFAAQNTDKRRMAL